MRLQFGRHVRGHLVRGGLRYAIGDVPEMLLCGPVREVDNQSSTTSDHARRGELARVIVRADSGGEHRIPSPERLLPERLHPRELAVVHHPLVPAPDAVDQHVDRTVLRNARECRLDVAVYRVIAADADCVFTDCCEIGFSAPGDEHLRTLPGQFARDAAADTAAAAGDDGYQTLDAHMGKSTLPA